MGVPALFRWLSKKYPKIICPVVEEEEIKLPGEDGEDITVPVDITGPNPNDVEFHNLYLDMNGIVHPCTHPEGKPAPETEEDMMIEVFKYTERVVTMIRPRKLLFIAIDGVAPRAKMNQQRSRRFRAAQEAKEKAEARKESIEMWKSMGKDLSEDEENNKEPWDSNAITPGTPFMDLLAASLRYWVVQKINTDPGWKKIQVIISDSSVPGEGEHKIMDFIRRQRTNPGHDPNTRHVIYGLDADLIMLSLATHEPYFRVLREDVFFVDGSSTACRNCGQEGHYAAQCTGEKAEIKKTPPEKKPFIFLDVAVLREYLEYELNIPQSLFPFNLEQAIDDWVLLIFFVGNDFLPHLPSLEIREGAIDTLLKIWKHELPRMGGYLTEYGQINLSRAQIILQGLAQREDEIFRKRREAEERQDQNAKRRKLEAKNSTNGDTKGPSPTLGLTAPTTGPFFPPLHPSLPPRPSFDFAVKADAIGLGGPTSAQSIENMPTATQALAGSNRDVVANRRAIRMANMSAAEMLKAELSGHPLPPKPDLSLPPKPTVPPDSNSTFRAKSSLLEASKMSMDATLITSNSAPGFGSQSTLRDEDILAEEDTEPDRESVEGMSSFHTPDTSTVSRGVKRKLDDAEDDEDESNSSDEEAAPAKTASAIKVNADGTVEQEDTVKLWEPGYKERYYRQKFGVEPTDIEFRKTLTKSYVEGLVWVLRYYYQGTPSWQWYYPHHFSPFAADFVDIDKMHITFEIGQPFKPFEQLMGVFPAASRKHIPDVFQPLMIEEDSPIIDFYPTTFEIDMNGKRMVWQGVALLPFIDEKRLLDAMAGPYKLLGEEQKHRNRWGNDVLFASDEHPIYPFFEELYGKRKKRDPIPIDVSLSEGISGTVLPNPDCLPGSTYYSPLTSKGLTDIKNDRSLSVLYFYPKQRYPHQSVLLQGVKRIPRILSQTDLENTRYGGRGRGNWEGGRGRGQGYHSRPMNYGASYHPPERDYSDRGGTYNQAYSSSTYGPRYDSRSHSGYRPSGSPQTYNYQQHYGGYGGQGSAPPRGGPQSFTLPPSSYDQSGYGSGYGGYNEYGSYGHGQIPAQGHTRGNSNNPPSFRGRGGWR